MNCPSCGAALAEDQRYCLNCGHRRGEPRVEFRPHLDAKEAAAPAPAVAENGDSPATAVAVAPPLPPAEERRRDYAPLAAAGGIAVLGVMLLIGVLIGRGTGTETSSAPPPQVVTVAGGEASGAGPEEEPEETSEVGGKSKKKGAGSKAKKKDKVVAGGSADTGNAPVASESQLEALQEKSGEEYAEESAKLPDEIATPGEPPPTDQKAPGGGSGGVTLE